MISSHSQKRKICVVTTSRADYGRLKPVMREIQNHPELELQVVAGTSLFLDHFFWYLRHGEPVSFLKSFPWYLRSRLSVIFNSADKVNRLEYLMKLLSRDDFPIHARLPMFLEGGNPRTMVKTAGLGMLGVPDIFEKLKPDIVLLHGDRFEILPLAMASAFLNIPLAHIEGGDVSGTIDNSVRHAVTKLAHIHFPVTVKSKERLIKMGEDPRLVFLTGSLMVDFLKTVDFSLGGRFYDRHGHGAWEAENVRGLDLTKPYLLVVQHPVTTEYDSNYSHTKKLIAAIDEIGHQTLFIAPNIDAGADGVSVALREYYHAVKPALVTFFRGFSPEDFCRLLANASVVVGNSSSLLREGGFLGTPAVLVGSRQDKRERAENVIEVGYDSQEIISAVKKQLEHGKYKSSHIFGDGTASKKIVNILADLDLTLLSLQKGFYE